MSDVLYGSKGSYCTIHVDRHLSGPTFLYVIDGGKLLWAEAFTASKQQVLSADVDHANRKVKEVQQLLLEGARCVHPGLLSELAGLGVGEVHELGPGMVSSMPPGFLHEAINLELTASYNVSCMPFDLWPDVLESTMRREADIVLGAAKEAVGGSGPELEAKLEELWSARGKYFGEGMLMWVKDMVVREEKLCKGLMSGAVDGDRLGLESEDVRLGTCLSLLLQQGRWAVWQEKPAAAGGHAPPAARHLRGGPVSARVCGVLKGHGQAPLLAMLQCALVTSTVDRRKEQQLGMWWTRVCSVCSFVDKFAS